MKNKYSHDDWIFALDKGEVTLSYIIKLTKELHRNFVWHPLGFLLCKLSDAEGKKLRLHIWPNNSQHIQDPPWTIHNHIFNLKSWVIAGVIKNTEYRHTKGNPTHRAYITKYNNNHSIIHRTDEELCIVKKRTQIVRSGQTYKIAAGVFHQSISSSQTTSITICETIDQPDRVPIIAGAIDGACLYTYKRAEVEKRLLYEIMDDANETPDI